MKSFHLHSQETQQIFFEEYLPTHPIDELLIVEFQRSEDLFRSLKSLLLETRHLSRFYLKIEDYLRDELQIYRQQIEDSQISLCIKLNLRPYPIGPVSEDLYRSTPIENFSSASPNFREWVKVFPSTRMSCEVLLEEQCLNALGPTLQYLAKFNPLFILLDPNHLDWSLAPKVRDQLNHFTTYSPKPTFIYFAPEHPFSRQWEARAENILRGPRFLDIDLSNACTHNCNFCGLYADEALEGFKKRSGGELSPWFKNHLKQKIDMASASRLMDQLPDKIDNLTFGGLGDPMTHTSFFEIVKKALKRGLHVSVISNFAYFTDEKIKELTELAAFKLQSIYYMVNISAARAQTYTSVRSNQPEKTFHRVVNHLRLSGELRVKYGKGIEHRLISITTKDNYHDLPELVGLAKYVMSNDLWFKPLEIHSETSLPLKISEKEALDYARKVRLALHFADRLDVQIYDREVLENLLHHRSSQLQHYDREVCPFETQVQKELDASHYLKMYYDKMPSEFWDHRVKIKDWRHLEKAYGEDLPKPTLTTTTIPRVKDQFGNVATNSFPSSYFSHLPCHIGYEYLRVTVDGQWLPCCISNYPVEERPQSSFLDTWLSGRMTRFREKTKRIHIEKFHMTDPQWKFCQQCVHRLVNEEHHRLAGKDVIYT